MADEVALTFGATGGFGTFTGWGKQMVDPAQSVQVASALGPTGDEAATDTYDDKTEISEKYACNNDTNTVPATIGKLYGAGILTSINIGTSNTAQASMDLGGHQHADATHADTLQQAAHGIAVSKRFGAIDFMGGTGDTGAAVVAGTVNITCQHTDELDADGKHLCGENYNCVITATTTWKGAVVTPVGAGWTHTGTTHGLTNTGIQTTTVTGRKVIAMVAPVP